MSAARRAGDDAAASAEKHGVLLAAAASARTSYSFNEETRGGVGSGAWKSGAAAGAANLSLSQPPAAAKLSRAPGVSPSRSLRASTPASTASSQVSSTFSWISD